MVGAIQYESKNMNVGTEQRLGVLIPEGKHILRPVWEDLNRRGFQPVNQRRNGHLYIEVKDPKVTFIAQNSKDIPRLVDQGIYPVGIVGNDRIAEYRASASLEEDSPPPEIELLDRLEVFNPNVRVSVLVRGGVVDSFRYTQLADLQDKRVITSYSGLTSEFFRKKEVRIELDGKASGKEEIQVFDNKAEAAVVIVNSGGTMRRWKLRELEGGVVMSDIQPIIIYNPNAIQDKGSEMLLEQFMDRFKNGRIFSISVPDLSSLPVQVDRTEPHIPAAV